MAGSPAKPSAWIFDVDGTLCDVSSVRHHVLERPKNFDAFHSGSLDCPPHQWVVDLARSVQEAGGVVVVVTARRERWWWHTVLWLAENDVPYDVLEMRGDRDDRKDYDVKRDILTRLRERYDIVHAVDDNPSVIALWQEEGIPTTVVPGWCYEPEQGHAQPA